MNAPADVLVDQHFDLVYSTCRRILGNDQDAADAAQDTFVRLLRSPRTTRTSDAGWLHACARSTALNRLRSEGRLHRRQVASARSDGAHSDCAVAEHEHAIESAEIAGIVDDCLAELDPDSRELLLAHHIQGRSLDDLAQGSGVGRSAVHKRLEKARSELRERMVRRLGPGCLVAITAFLSTGLGASESPPGLAARIALGAAGKTGAKTAAIKAGGTWMIAAAAAVVVVGVGIVGVRTLGAAKTTQTAITQRVEERPAPATASSTPAPMTPVASTETVVQTATPMVASSEPAAALYPGEPPERPVSSPVPTVPMQTVSPARSDAARVQLRSQIGANRGIPTPDPSTDLRWCPNGFPVNPQVPPVEVTIHGRTVAIGMSCPISAACLRQSGKSTQRLWAQAWLTGKIIREEGRLVDPPTLRKRSAEPAFIP